MDLFPIVSIATLSAILRCKNSNHLNLKKHTSGTHHTNTGSTKASSCVKYQIALLICLQLAHNTLLFHKQSNTNSNGEEEGTDDVVTVTSYDQIVILSYLTILLSIVDSILSMKTTGIASLSSSSSSLDFLFVRTNSASSRRNKNKNQMVVFTQRLCRIFFQYLNLKMILKAAIPATIVLLYATIWIQLEINMKMGMSNGYRNLMNGEQWQQTIFFITWFATIVYYTLQRRRIIKSLKIHNSDSSSSNDFYSQSGMGVGMGDKKKWEHWSTEEFLSWVVSIYRIEMHQRRRGHGHGHGHGSGANQISYGDTSHTDMDMDNNTTTTMDESDIIEIVAILSQEKIHGGCIPFLQLNHLRSFGISYGAAVIMIKGMEELTGVSAAARMQSQSYPGVGGGLGDEDGIDLDEWLGRKIGEIKPPTSTHDKLYNVDDPAILAEVISALNDAENGNKDADGDDARQQQDFGMGGMDVDNMDIDSNELDSGRAKEFMNSRFGLELPEVRTGKGLSTQEQEQDTRTLISSSASSMPMPMSNGSNGNNGDSVGMEENSNVQFDQALLDSMPESVRDIAKRRPDLVQALMQSKQQQTESVARSRANLPSILEDGNQGDLGVGMGGGEYTSSRSSPGERQNCMPGFEEADAEDEEYGNWDGTGGYNDERFGLLRRRSTPEIMQQKTSKRSTNKTK